MKTFAAWKLGRAGIDDGLAVFVLSDDRAIDIEVGYGLEGAVPDAVASHTIHDVMTPRLEDRDGSVTAGTEALVTAIDVGPWGAWWRRRGRVLRRWRSIGWRRCAGSW